MKKILKYFFKAIFLFVGAIILIILLSTFSKTRFSNVATLCDENFGDLRLAGYACRPIVVMGKYVLKIKTADKRTAEVFFNIPWNLIEQRTKSKAFIILEVPIEYRQGERKEIFNSKINISLTANKKMQKLGSIFMTERFKNSKWFALLREDNLYSVFRAMSGYTSEPTFKYIVPKNQPPRQLYFKCARLCRMHSAYRYISYNVLVPKSWMAQYPHLQRVMEEIIDRVIIEEQLELKEE